MADLRKILLLGGTDDAVRLNQSLAGHPGVELITSLAGRTRNPGHLSGNTIVGGFGGEEGLRQFITDNHINFVIDASHPFADKITRNAINACAVVDIPFVRLQRPEWKQQPGDCWVSVASVKDAASKLCAYNRIFLTVGRQELAPFEDIADKFFLVRSIEKAEFAPQRSEVSFIQGRGPFSVEDEFSLLRERRVDLLVSKNSGGTATYAKIEAARRLGIPVIMIERPALPDCTRFSDVKALLLHLGL
ncbi:cobalt-precorrin-6A reductase [Sneathiella litorea]|uniref:Cobalt-precorrin-6A reductase n=1 Tax=Sneathiella litorea TaxID=2606216 RepID=A0A6L8W9T9_9PROT|nr:cobalt-precorrin-6A reductase [Sneathiella litorea]MZR31314.1 cobalt-precorrin-6A reductase [Sneathiella litorea]